MPFGIEQDAAPDDFATSTPETDLELGADSSGAAGTPETVEETDEQKNERVIRERTERSEKQARGVQRRIDELTADKHAERSAREALQRRLDELEAKARAPQEQNTDPKRDASGKPLRDAYDDIWQYQEDLAEWKATRIVQQYHEATERRLQEQQQQRALGELESKFDKSISEFEKVRPDYREKMAAASEVMIPVEIGNAIKALPNGPAVALFMAENPKVVEALSRQPSVMQGYVLGNISAHVSTSSKQVSNAPAPGRPVGGVGGGGSDEPPTDTAAYNRWAAKRGL